MMAVKKQLKKEYSERRKLLRKLSRKKIPWLGDRRFSDEAIAAAHYAEKRDAEGISWYHEDGTIDLLYSKGWHVRMDIQRACAKESSYNYERRHETTFEKIRKIFSRKKRG